MNKKRKLRLWFSYHLSRVLLACGGERGIIGALAWCKSQTVNRLQQKLVIRAANEPTPISTPNKQSFGGQTLDRHRSRELRIQMLEFQTLLDDSLAPDFYMAPGQRLATVRCIVIAARILACKVAGVAIMTRVISVALDLLQVTGQMNDVIEGLGAILGDERARQMTSDIGITSVGRTRKLISIPNVFSITNEETVDSANLLNAGLTHSGPSSGRTISCKPSCQLWPVDRSTIDYSIIEITLTMAYQNASPVVNAFGKTRLQESLERARDRLGPSLGQWLALPGHALAKTIAPLGEDWVLIDCEHGHIDDYNMYLQISAISSSGVSPVVRIPAGEPWMVKRALDAGAHAIMVPMCETKEQAMQIVESAKYPSKSYPNGFRGTGAMFAPAAFNLTGREYLLNANSNVMIFVQIESRKGVENVEEIAKVDGIDMLFIGPNDLASSLGYVAFDHATTPEVQQATQRILDATLAAGKYAGHFALDAATAAQRYEQGFHFVNCGADIVALTSQMSAEIRKVKDLTTKDFAYHAANGSGSENGVKSLDGRGNGSVDAVKLY
ncbi:hypothetical protein FOXB_05879 [Fusarium oxysporum f. sp. conglutinans Fo5176]|uniref:HpcH/HpaI aldolase/citrate lyase domain-containing protein n=4 Tax=Fusarium oxysporum TaxID=5507 RepID=F9FHK0_FUSOF|nr:hypothetical protein FOXB_05879 [Fusarium oxysporum f. sp. conglutinans Fo5176]